MEPGNEKEKGGDVEAEAVFARKEVKEFPFQQGTSFCAMFFAPVSTFGEDLFVGDSPCDAGNGDGQDEEPYEL